MKFIRFFVIWISQNLAIPFWIVGHIHLTLNVYADLKEIFASVGMNLIVIVGFILDYRNSLKDDRTRDTKEKNKAT